MKNISNWLLAVLLLWSSFGHAQFPDHSFNPSNPSNPYGLTDLDNFPVGSYGYCKWGNLMSSGGTPDSGIFLGFTKLTKGPFVNSTYSVNSPELFLLKSTDSLVKIDFPSTASWTPANGDSVAGGVNFLPGNPDPSFQVALMRKLHFSTLLAATEPDGSEPPLDARAEKLIVLIHGWNPDSNRNSYTDDKPMPDSEFNCLITQLLRQIPKSGWKLIRYRWEADADTGPVFSFNNLSIPEAIRNGSRAAEIAHQHGQHLGEVLSKTCPSLGSIHFIAHSAGSWAARAAAKYLLATNPTLVVQVTLLDPFIPGASPFTGNTSLTVANMNTMTEFTGANRIFQLENYFSNDVSGPGTEQRFTWRAQDVGGYRVDWTSINPYPHYGDKLLNPGAGHFGPIQFYSDTVVSTVPGATVPSDLADAPYYATDSDILGFRRSLFWYEPIIVQQPQNRTVDAGNSATFTVPLNTRWHKAKSATADTSVFKVQWQKDGVALAGQTSPTLTIASSTTSDAGEYVAIVSNAAGSTKSLPAILTVNAATAAPTITQQPQDQTALVGQTATFVVGATGTGTLNYQWKRNGTAISGATSASFTTTPVALANDGYTYQVVITDSQGTKTSRLATLTVVAATSASNDPYEPNNSSATATPLASGVSRTAYVDSPADVDWFKVDVSTGGSLTFSLTVPSNSDYDLELYGPDNAFLLGSYQGTGQAENIAYATSVTGTYYGRVYGYPAGNGSFNTATPYSLAYTFNTTPVTLPTVTVSASAPNAAEQGNTPGRFTLTRTGSTTLALSVNYTLSGTALNGTDYLLLNGAAIIPVGGTSADVVVTPIDDALPEGNETVILSLATSSTYTLGSPNSATVTIADNDTVTTPTDTTKPTVAFINPNGSPFYTTMSTVLVNGKAYDNIGVTRVTWANGAQSGTADTLPDDTGNTGWSVSALPLVDGANVITITAFDAAGNSGFSTVTVQASLNSGNVATPTEVTASKGTYDGIVRVTWNSANLAGYEIWRSTVNDTATASKIGQVALQGYFDDNNAFTRTTYYYWIKAYDSANHYSQFSASDTGFRKYVAPTLSSLTINGPSFVVQNTTGQFSATAYYSDGSSQGVSASSWSSDSAVAPISAAGLLTAGPIISDTTTTIATSYSEGGIVKTASRVVILRANAGSVLEVPSQYGTIQTAITAAQAGDTVHVAPGNYDGDIFLRDGVNLQGSGPDKSKLNGITHSANNVTISGFGAGTGGYWKVYVENNNGSVTLDNNVFVWSRAVQVNNAATVTMRNNIFNGTGFLVDAFYSPRITVENNTFNSGEIYIFNLRNSAQVILRNNIIANRSDGIQLARYNNDGLQYVFSSFNTLWNTAPGLFTGATTAGQSSNDAVTDPQFVSAAAGDFHLQPTSSSLNSGDPAAVYNDLDGTRNDKGTYGGPGLKQFPKASQTISFGPVTNCVYGTPSVALSASASSGLPVAFSVLSGPANLSGNTITVTGAGVIVLNASQTGDANFLPAPDVVQSFTVSNALLMVTATNTSKVYGATNPSFGATLNGFVNGETTSTVTGQPNFSTVAATSSPIGTYPVTPSLGSLRASNYSFVFAPGTLMVTPAALTVRANDSRRGYGTSNPVFSGTFEGLVNGDTLGAVLGAPLLTTTAQLSSPAGVYPITASLGSLSASNYTLRFVDGVLTVEKASLTVTPNAVSRTYGSTNPPLVASLTGFAIGDSPSVVSGVPTITTDATAGSPVGTYLQKAALGTLSATNYSFVFADGYLSVTKATPVVVWPNPPAIKLGKPLGSEELNATANVSGVFSYTPPAGTILNIGSGQALSGLFQPDDGTNFTSTIASVLIDVLKADQTITFSPLGNRTFGDLPFTLNATADSGLPVSFSIVSGPATKLNSMVTLTGAGLVTVRASQAGNTNYNAATSVDQSFSVSQANPVITWVNPADITFGAALGATQLNATASIPGSFTYTPTNGTVLNSGSNQTLSVSFTPTDLANYSPASASVLVNVLKADQTITFGPLTNRALGDGPFALSASASSGLPVSFSIISGPATNLGGVVTLTGAGAVVVRASQSGSTNYNAALGVEQPFIVFAPPLITVQPQSVIVVRSNILGSFPASFIVTTANATNFQWQFNGIDLAGATGTNLTLPDARRTNSGVYAVVVAGPGGTVRSSNAVLRVMAIQAFANAPVRLGDGGIRLLFGDHDGGLLSANDATNIAVEFSPDLKNWFTLTNAFTISNGQVQVDDTGSANLPRRYYRIIER